MSRLQRAPAVSPVLAVAGSPPPLPARTPSELDDLRYGAGPGPRQPEQPAGQPTDPVERKEKVGGYYAYPSDIDRIRSAWFHTQTREDGYTSLSEMHVQVMLREAERLEREHNGGEPFPVVPAGKVRHSRRS